MVRIGSGLLALAFALVLEAQVRVRPGMWENTVTSNGKSVTHNGCLTAADTASMNGSVAEIRAAMEKAVPKGGGCSLKDVKVDGNTQTDVMVCGKTTFVNTTVYHGGDSLETTTTSTESGSATKTSVIKSRRTGDCTK